MELTPTQLHIFEAVTVAASGSSASLDLSITGASATAPSGAGRTRHEFYIQGKVSKQNTGGYKLTQQYFITGSKSGRFGVTRRRTLER